MTLLRENIDDKGYVELLDVMPYDYFLGDDVGGNTAILRGLNRNTGSLSLQERAIVTAARTSYLSESYDNGRDLKLLKYLFNNRHTTPFEMVEFKFKIYAPLMMWWQEVRHRTQSINMQSGRYTEFEENDFYFPDVWRLQHDKNKQMSANTNLTTALSEDLTCDLQTHWKNSYALYIKAIEMGVAREQARLFLPAYGVYYAGIVKMNAHNLMHFLELRCAKEAQYEIRVYAEAMKEMFYLFLPNVGAMFNAKISEAQT